MSRTFTGRTLARVGSQIRLRIEPGELGQGGRVIRRTRGNTLPGLPTMTMQHSGAGGQAGLTLADAGAEPRVPLQRLDIAVTEGNGVLELVQCDVFTAADEDLHFTDSAAGGRARRKCRQRDLGLADP